LNEDGKQPFAAFVIEALARREAEVGGEWAAELVAPSGDGGARGVAAGEAVRVVLAAARQGQSVDTVTTTGRALAAAAHARNVSLHRMIEEIDLLETILLQVVERAASDYVEAGGLVSGQEAVAAARCISDAVSSLRLAATRGYARAIEDELRERYRTIRHDLRNPLGTIKSAIALLTDESLPTEMRQSSRVRAMVARNARSLDQMIGEALGDDAAALDALGATRRAPDARATGGHPGDAGDSGREQRDDLRGARQRPDLEPGAF